MLSKLKAGHCTQPSRRTDYQEVSVQPARRFPLYVPMVVTSMQTVPVLAPVIWFAVNMCDGPATPSQELRM